MQAQATSVFESMVPATWGSVVEVSVVDNTLYVYAFGDLLFSATRPNGLISCDSEVVMHNNRLWLVNDPSAKKVH